MARENIPTFKTIEKNGEPSMEPFDLQWESWRTRVNFFDSVTTLEVEHIDGKWIAVKAVSSPGGKDLPSGKLT
jgi:hypothetical protein